MKIKHNFHTINLKKTRKIINNVILKNHYKYVKKYIYIAGPKVSSVRT